MSAQSINLNNDASSLWFEAKKLTFNGLIQIPRWRLAKSKYSYLKGRVLGATASNHINSANLNKLNIDGFENPTKHIPNCNYSNYYYRFDHLNSSNKQGYFKMKDGFKIEGFLKFL